MTTLLEQLDGMMIGEGYYPNADDGIRESFTTDVRSVKLPVGDSVASIIVGD